jgi:Flp pilus assembly protein TadG
MAPRLQALRGRRVHGARGIVRRVRGKEASMRARGERGAALMEFAVALPLLLILMFSIVDFGLYFFAQHTVQFATREGVRLALVGRTLADGAGNAMSREASIVRTISDKAAVAVNPTKLQISIFPVDPEYGDPVDWQTTQNAGAPGSYMRVRTRYDYHFITPLLGALMPNGRLSVRAQATYRNELF